MDRGGNILLLTGPSGVGKSHLLRRVADSVAGPEARGIISQSIWSGDRREGWRLESLAGSGGIYIRRDMESPHQLETAQGKYGVDLVLLENLAGSELDPANGGQLYFIDEISRTGMMSKKFMDMVNKLFESGKTIVAAVHPKAGGFVQEIRSRPDVELWELSLENRDEMFVRVLEWIAARLNQ